jgi:hypothetical protein
MEKYYKGILIQCDDPTPVHAVHETEQGTVAEPAAQPAVAEQKKKVEHKVEKKAEHKAEKKVSKYKEADLKDMTKVELEKLAKKLNITIGDKTKKELIDDLINA